MANPVFGKLFEAWPVVLRETLRASPCALAFRRCGIAGMLSWKVIVSVMQDGHQKTRPINGGEIHEMGPL